MNKTLTTVSITSSMEPTALSAAAELSKYLQKKGVAIKEDGFAISIVVDNSVAQDSYQIEVTENGMTVTGDANGVLYGVYNFLEKYAGIRFFTPTLEICPKGEIILPMGEILSHTPAMKARRLTWHSIAGSPEWCVKHGINFGVNIPAELGGQRLNYGKLFVHTINIRHQSLCDRPRGFGKGDQKRTQGAGRKPCHQHSFCFAKRL